jgi:Acetyl xylan esterase (AXE1)
MYASAERTRKSAPSLPKLSTRRCGTLALFDFPLDQLEQYAPAVAEPADFDVFWRSTLERAAVWPVVVDVRPERNELDLFDTWDVTFSGFDGDPSGPGSPVRPEWTLRSPPWSSTWATDGAAACRTSA